VEVPAAAVQLLRVAWLETTVLLAGGSICAPSRSPRACRKVTTPLEFFVLSVLEFELRALCSLGRRLPLEPFLQLFSVLYCLSPHYKNLLIFSTQFNAL
jgi:hypothetical protein